MMIPLGSKGIALLDILLSNVDGHATNVALFHPPGGRRTTTPSYDAMPTMQDRRTTDEFAYFLGAATSLDDVTSAALEQFMSDLGVAFAAGRRRVLTSVLKEAISTLNAQIEGVKCDDKHFADLIGTSIRTPCSNLSIVAAIPSRDRDTFGRN